MLLTFQIAVGIWLGGLFLTGTFTAYFVIAARIERNKRFGAPWHQGLFHA